MTRQMSYRHVRTSKASPERLFELLLDPSGWSRWAPLVKKGKWEAHPDGGSEPAVGSVRLVGAGGVLTREQVTVHEPGRRHGYTILGNGPVVNYQSLVTLSPEGSGTRLVWEGTMTPKPIVGHAFGMFTKVFVGKLADGLIAYAEGTD